MIYTKHLKHDNCKYCIRTCEHAGKDREFCYSKDVSCKKTDDKFDNIRKEAVKEFAEKLKEKIKSLKVAEDEDYIFKCGFDVLQENLPEIIDELLKDYEK